MPMLRLRRVGGDRSPAMSSAQSPYYANRRYLPGPESPTTTAFSDHPLRPRCLPLLFDSSSVSPQHSFIACRQASTGTPAWATPPNSDRVILKSPTCRSPHYSSLGHATQELTLFLRGFSSPLNGARSPFLSLSSKHSTDSFSPAVPPEVIFLVCYYLDPQQLLILACANRLVYFLVCRHPIWKEIVIKDFGFKYENYRLPEANELCNFKLLYEKICCFKKTIRSGQANTYAFPEVFAPGSAGTMEQRPEVPAGPNHPYCAGVDEVSICMSMDLSELIWQKGSKIKAVKLTINGSGAQQTMSTTKLWELDLSVDHGVHEDQVLIPNTCLVIAGERLFIFIAHRLFAISMKTGRVLKELVGPLRTGRGGWDVGVDPTLDVSLRNNKLAVLCNDIISVWDVLTLRQSYMLECPEIEKAVIKARFLHLESLYRQRQARQHFMRSSPDEVLSPNSQQQLLGSLTNDTPRESQDQDINFCPITDFSWAGYRCASGPNGSECFDCFEGHGQSLSCIRRSRCLLVWFRDRSPRMWLYDAEKGTLERVVCAADPTHVAEWERSYQCGRQNTLDYSDAFLSCPCIRRVKHVANISDPRHVFLVTLDTRGTIRLFDSSRDFAQLAVLRTGDCDIWRINLSSNVLFTMSIRADSSEGRVDPPNLLRFWRFQQPSVTEDLVVPIQDETTDEDCTGGARGWMTCSSLPDRPDWMQLSRQNHLPDIFSPCSAGTPCATGLSAATPMARTTNGTASSQILSYLGGCSVPSSVYLCDIIDNTFLAFWHSIPSARGLFDEETDSLYAVSNWRIHEPGKDLLDSDQPDPVLPVAIPGKRVYALNNRADAWSLLDWRSVSVLTNGTLIVHDLCPISDKKDTSIVSPPLQSFGSP